MPTIEQLDPVIVAADDDTIPVSQGGTMRRVTRAQFLTGMQPTLSLSPGLLGRVSQGFGAPEQVTIGSGLSFTNGVLSGPPGYSVSSLPTSSAASVSDLIPVGQAGRDRAVSVGSLLSTPGIDVSLQYASSQAGIARRLAEWMSDTPAIEAFGAVGDGTTDDTAAFSKAVASGHPVRLGPKTYRVDGQWTITTSCVLLGIPGISTLRRTTQSGGAWISVVATSFAAHGIRFDAGTTSVDSWGILINPSCTQTVFQNCIISNVAGATLGSGLVIQARDGLSGHTSSHSIRGCCFSGNAGHGLWVQAAAGVLVDGCSAFQNGGYGICLDWNDPTFQNVVRQAVVTGCRCWNNERGISVGNYNETNLEPPRWGLGNPDAVDVLVTGNICSDNAAYGIAVSGKRIQVCRNQINVGPSVGGASGILCNASNSSVSANVLDGPGMFGIDAGGCADCDILSNIVEGFDVGINAGGGQSIRVAGNRLLSNGRGITAFQVETDGNGGNFGLPCKDLTIDGNIVLLKDSSGGGVILVDGPENVVITDNNFRSGPSSHPAQAIMSCTDSVSLARNRWDGSDRFVVVPVSAGGGGATLVIPEVFDDVSVSTVDGTVNAIEGEFAASLAGQISFLRVTDGGTGYQTASVSIIGSGMGAAAEAYIRDGAIVGFALSAGGSGYGKTPTQVTITGNGTGATAQAFVGVPIPSGRRLQMSCATATRFSQSAASGQTNWTGADITIPPGANIVWAENSGNWRAVSFANIDYLAPDSGGAVALQSRSGDVTPLPASNGQVRVRSSSEANGFTSTLGRGSPEGAIAAPPGSDYRNLNGGIGATLWLKRVGVGATGWFAIA